MIPSSEIPAALAHVAGAAKSRILVVAPRVDDVLLDFIRASVAPDVRVEIVHHERIKAVIADRNLAVVLSTSLTSAGTGVGFIPPFDGHQPNIEDAVLVDDPAEVVRLVGPLR